MSTPPPDQTPLRPSAPPPLLVAASLAALEGVLLAGYGLVLFSAVDRSRLALGLTTPVFFLLYGVALVGCGWALSRMHSWARAPLVLAQLIQLGIAWSNFSTHGSAAVTTVLAVIAVVVLVGVFHPTSIAALSHHSEPQ